MHPVSSPANRTEWNRKGMLIVDGDGYNISGNFFDRSRNLWAGFFGGRQN